MGKINRGIIGSAMRYSQITLLIIALLVIMGIYGLERMPKQEFPEYTIRQGLVVAVYPGATSMQVEQRVAQPLENYLFTFNEVNRERSYSISRDGILYFMIELNDDVNNKNEVWSKIKLGLEEFKMTLPKEVIALVAKDDFGDTSALLVSIESSDKTYRELGLYLENLESQLRRIPSVSNIRRYGLLKEEIVIEIDKDKLAMYGLDVKAVMAKLAVQDFNMSVGKIRSGNHDMPLHVSANFISEREIADQILYSDKDGNIVRVKDIAEVYREYPDSEPYIKDNGNRAVVLSMEMRPGKNIVEYGEEVDEVLHEFQKTLPESVRIRRIADQPKVVDTSVTSFIRDLFISIIVVIVVMMLLFPFRSALVAATSIPISIFISLAVMYLCNIPLNTVTLAALIAALGMIVDNSIIVIDAYLEKLDMGMSKWNAAISSAKDYFWSVFLATFCICIIFFPLLLTLSGIMLDFLKMFPWTISIALMSSLAVAMVFIPFMERLVIKKGLGRNKPKKGFNLLDVVQRGYNKLLDFNFRHPYATLGMGLFSIVLGAYLLMNLSRRMLPCADRDQFAVEIYLPQGTSLERTGDVCDSLYRCMSRDGRIVSITSFIGQSSPRFHATYAPQIGGNNYAQFIVNTVSNDASVDLIREFSNKYSEMFPDAYVKFKQIDYQVAQAPVEVRIAGNDIRTIKDIADSVKVLMRDVEGLRWIRTNFEEPLPSVKISLHGEEASKSGITSSMVASELSVLYGKLPVGSVWEGNYPVTVSVKGNAGEGNGAFSLSDDYISAVIPGVSVPLRQIADIEPEWNEGQIVRRNGIRTISVMAEILIGSNADAAQKEVERLLEEKIFPSLPENISISFGGEKEANDNIMPPIYRGLTASVFIVFFFLLFNFKKIGLAVAAMSSVLFTLVGASVGLMISGHDFSITCILGIIGLIGVVVRNAIIMFEHAQNLRLNCRYTAKDAAYDAGKRRMLPIFLTSATTAVGVVPMIISNTSLWGPMGVVIFSGTIFCTFLAVTVLPVLYWKIFPDKK